MTNKRLLTTLLVLLLALLTAACTGQGGTDEPPTLAPTAEPALPATDEPAQPPTEEPATEEPTTEEPAAAADPLAGTRWDLVQYGPADAPITPISQATANFADGQMTGTTGCNSYFGDYSLDGEKLTIGPGVGQTEMACMEGGVMEQEQAFTSALLSVQSYALSDDALTLTYDGGQLVFAPAVDLTLEGRIWQLSGIAIGNAIMQTWIDPEITALFEEGLLSGYSGCNQYNAQYTLDGEVVTVGPIATTRRACEEERTERELEYLTALEKVTGYEISRDSLRLLDANGQLALMFVPAEAPAEGISLAELGNAMFLTDMTAEGTATLVDGEFRAPAAPGSAAEIVITLLDHVASGDLDADGAVETVAMLAASGGGTGTFYSLHVMERQGEAIVDVATTYVGDRIVVNSLNVASNGLIELDAVKQGPEDPLCCPSERVLERYALANGELIFVESLPIDDASVPGAAVPGGLDGFVAVLQEAIQARDLGVLQSLMADPFAFGAYASEWVSLAPSEAIEGFRQEHLPEGASIAFSPPETDLASLLGGIPPASLLGPEANVALVLHSTGWGQDGEEEVMLFLTEREDGQYRLAAFLYAPFGFDLSP
jgi:heat shock protein HslJ